MRALADWWDAVELWVTQLPFPFQVLLAIVVVLPVCWGLATLLDRVAGVVDGFVSRRRVPPVAPDEPAPEPTAVDDTLVLDAVTPAGHGPVDGDDGR